MQLRENTVISLTVIEEIRYCWLENEFVQVTVM